jgi:hypothetical protein
MENKHKPKVVKLPCADTVPIRTGKAPGIAPTNTATEDTLFKGV